MPPCAMCEEAALAPEQKSPRSTSSTSTPLSARSRNVPMPLMPPPTITTGISGLPFSEARISFRFICFFHHELTRHGAWPCWPSKPASLQASRGPVECPCHRFLPVLVEPGTPWPIHRRVPAFVFFPVGPHILRTFPEADCQPRCIGRPKSGRLCDLW